MEKSWSEFMYTLGSLQGTICNVLDGQLSVSNAPSLHTAMHTKVRVTQ